MRTKQITFNTWEEFERRYHPLKNYMTERSEFNGCLYETFGDDLRFITNLIQLQSRHIWTIIDTEDGSLYLRSGLHTVNRLGYIITRKTFKKNERITVSETEYK